MTPRPGGIVRSVTSSRWPGSSTSSHCPTAHPSSPTPSESSIASTATSSTRRTRSATTTTRSTRHLASTSSRMSSRISLPAGKPKGQPSRHRPGLSALDHPRMARRAALLPGRHADRALAATAARGSVRGARDSRGRWFCGRPPCRTRLRHRSPAPHLRRVPIRSGAGDQPRHPRVDLTGAGRRRTRADSRPTGSGRASAPARLPHLSDRRFRLGAHPRSFADTFRSAIGGTGCSRQLRMLAAAASARGGTPWGTAGFRLPVRPDTRPRLPGQRSDSGRALGASAAISQAAPRGGAAGSRRSPPGRARIRCISARPSANRDRTQTSPTLGR